VRENHAATPVEYTRNGSCRIAAVEPTYAASTLTLADDAAYEPFGPLATVTFDNGLVLERTFDRQYRLTPQTTGVSEDCFQCKAALDRARHPPTARSGYCDPRSTAHHPP
jgi:hypothetical protein